MQLLFRSAFCLSRRLCLERSTRAFATSSSLFNSSDNSSDSNSNGNSSDDNPTHSEEDRSSLPNDAPRLPSFSHLIGDNDIDFTSYPYEHTSNQSTDVPAKLSDVIQELPDNELFSHTLHLTHLPTSTAVAAASQSKVPAIRSRVKRRPIRRSVSQFTDVMVIKLASGAGGNGNVTFFRDAGHAKGPPDGGDGGDGGSIYVQAVEGDSSLHKLQKRIIAENGESGRPSQMDGRNGKDIIIRVPVGTYITLVPGTQLTRENPPPGQGWIHSTGFKEFNEERDFFKALRKRKVLDDKIQTRKEEIQDAFPNAGIDLTKPGHPVLLLKGGRGGLGNRHFHTADIRNPRFATQGRAGLKGIFRFELKLLADLGLVGLPNAGKSTLLRAISRARPRIGHWEFTTLSPSVGTISLDIATADDSFSVADIPGIIAGANLNRGMGVDFLRHIERTKGLVFVVGLDGENPADDLRVLINELGPERLNGKKKLVVATKADLPRTQQKYIQLVKYAESLGWKALPVSAIRKAADIEIMIRQMAALAGVLNQ
ncbi:hypothetical protein BZA70DRAFT_280276 [Myxozyma melibiosi]|uniref:GTPase n=1 Tax=Myxozyma melibiosi TaxID=54550 RepID=A0ABR1F4Z7_9ASCO